MITILTRRLILIGLIFAVFGSGVALVVGKENRHDRSWIAGQAVPCPAANNPSCHKPAISE